MNSFFLQKFHQAKCWVKFYFLAKTKYDVHSPFVFELISEVLESKKYYYFFDDLEHLRKKMLNSKAILNVEDFGAGSQVLKSNQRPLAKIAASSLSDFEECQFLFRLVHHYKPKNVLELGTSLGLSALYLSKANSETKIYTIEGSKSIADVAKTNFGVMKAKNIECTVGNIDEVLVKNLEKIKNVDLLFLDGNHQKEPTLRYFEQSLPFLTSKSVVIFDDIYWSAEMTSAWEEVKKHPNVKVSVDIYHFGLIFFNEEIKEKQDFRLIKTIWKPWRMGFFA
jgi:predicted O-methyltransferase YrrM